MALSSHEMYLVLRARDEASRILRGFGNEFSNLSGQALQAAQKQIAAGAALTTVGVGIAAAGIAGLQFLNNATDAAIEYNKSVALTSTQLDKVKLSFQELRQMGLDLANTMPVAFEEIQPALYDIFSSIDTDAPGAAILLRNIGKAAVGGSVDMQTAGRATIAVLNAYKKPASEVTAVNDVMFQLVRKGVGTYEQFTSVIGRSIPSAIRAGQSFETLAGMMAFMTRNGMSTAQATTSAARALDALSNPKSVTKFKEWGVALTDSKGKFRDVTDIIADMREKLDKLSPAAKSAKLQELFAGSGGTIQAMRFFNLALSDSNNLLPEMVGHMNNAQGAADAAFSTMANTPAGKLQLLNNQYMAMKVTLGEQLIPVKLELVKALSKLLTWWNSLSDSTKKNIAIVLLVVSALAVLVGIVTAIAGLFLMFAGAAALAGVALSTVGIVIVAVVAAIALIGVAVFFIIKYWDEIKAWTISTWTTIKDWVVNAVTAIRDWIVNAWNTISSTTSSVWNAIVAWIVNAWNTIWAFVAGILTSISNFIIGIWTNIVTFIQGVLTAIGGVIQAGLNFVLGIWNAVWGLFGPLVMAVWNFIKAAIDLGITAIRVAIHLALTWISGVWNSIWTSIKNFVVPIWNAIYAWVAGKINAVKAVVSAVTSAISSWWNAKWNAVRSYVVSVWSAIYSWVAGKINAVRAVISSVLSAVNSFISGKMATIRSIISAAWTYVSSRTSAMWNTIVSTVGSKVEAVMSKVRSLKDKVTGFFSGAINWLKNAGANLIQGLVNGITSKIDAATEKMRTLTAKLKSFLPGSPIKTGPLKSWNNGGAGKRLIELLALGLRKTGPVEDAMRRMGRRLTVSPTITAATITPVDFGPWGPGGPGSGGYGPGSPGMGGTTIHQQIDITTQEIDPLKHAADLGWELAVRI